MDLAFTDDQTSLRDLAKQIFIGHCSDERLRAIESTGEAFDADLWAELARAHLLGFGIDEELGGNGGGIVELCLLLEQAGRAAAPVPLWAALLCGAFPVSLLGTDEQKTRLLPPLMEGGRWVTAAFEEPQSRDPLSPDCLATPDEDGWRLWGIKVHVPAVGNASRVLIPASAPNGVGVFLLDPARATIAPQPNTSAEPLWMITMDGVAVESTDVLIQPGDVTSLRIILDHALTGLCAMQTGISEAALRLTAEYTSGREQFGKPLGSFQAVQQRAADAYVDVEAMRWTMWHAAWLLSEGLPATDEVAEAKYFAAEGGHRVLAAAQHLHGGIGVDMSYPLHRYTFLSKQAELTLGGATDQLARLGDRMAVS
ncbi:MAG: acyl-CoA dehydrogenase family protein [Actinomycetota bacterium]